MTSCPLKLIALLILTFLPCYSCAAQAQGRKSAQELLTEVEEDEKLAVECIRKLNEEQIAKFGKVLPSVSLCCSNGCPTQIVRPYYPSEARRAGISGLVKVETIVNENGHVIFARAVLRKPFLSQAAERAAYLSSYMPKKTCGDKPIKFRWTIIYYFILGR